MTYSQMEIPGGLVQSHQNDVVTPLNFFSTNILSFITLIYHRMCIFYRLVVVVAVEQLIILEYEMCKCG